jgi:hypothetical protein
MVNKGNKIVLENCLYVPNFQYNLISVSKLDQLGYKIVVEGGQAHNTRMINYLSQLREETPYTI